MRADICIHSNCIDYKIKLVVMTGKVHIMHGEDLESCKDDNRKSFHVLQLHAFFYNAVSIQ